MPSTSNWSRPRVLVVGCGGLGGIVAANLAGRGERVFPVARRRDVVEAIAERGFEVRGVGGTRRIQGRAYLGIPADAGPFELAILATQPHQVERAAAEVAPHLAPDGAVVCLQNGLCEPRVAQVLGDPARVLGAVVTWGASSPRPGVFERTSRGGFVVGALRTSAPVAGDRVADDRLVDDRRLVTLTRLLGAVGPTTTTDNLQGVRWSKLAINCVISALGTIGGERLGPLVRLRHVRRLALEIITEVVAVAIAADVRLEPLSGALDLRRLSLTERERGRAACVSLASKHSLLLAIGLRYRRLRSSMLAAIERGDPPPVEFLNGEVSSHGRELEMPTPLNDAVVELVQRIGRSEILPHRDNLRRLYERTRQPLRWAPQGTCREHHEQHTTNIHQ